MSVDDLRAALAAAFPPVTITHALVHASDAHWRDYEEREHLSELEGASWDQLAPASLERHAPLLVHAGDELFRVILPAYLQLVAEGSYATMLPFLVIGQLTRDSRSTYNSEMFERRVAPLTSEQRAVVRRALAVIATQPVLHDAARQALDSWQATRASESA